jgi:hypothetical protein
MGDVAGEADGIGDIPTVLHLIRLGEDRPRPLRPAEIVELVERVDLMELWRGCLTLLQGWLGGCTQPEVLDAVVHRLRKLGRFPKETLAIVREGLTAVTSTETATSWRRQRQLEHISGIEVAAWLHAVWLVADLIDMSQGKGTVADATLGALMELAEEANEGNRRCGFCDVHQDQANILIAGAGVYICDRCLGIQLARPLPDHLQGTIAAACSAAMPTDPWRWARTRASARSACAWVGR